MKRLHSSDAARGDVVTIESRAEVVVSTRVKRFDAESLAFRLSVRGARGYDVAPDGERILVRTERFERAPTIAIVNDVVAWIRSRS